MTSQFKLFERAGTAYIKTLIAGASSLVGSAHRLGWLPTEGVKVINDTPYGTIKRKQAIDVYLPEKPRESGRPHPWVFFIHGGGWATGNRKMGAAMGRLFARRGIAVIAAGYRLAPEVSLGDQLQDLQAAMRFVHKHQHMWNLDEKRFAIVGESAGAHLTLRLTQEFPEELPEPKAVVGVYGVYDFKSWSDKHGFIGRHSVRYLLSRIKHHEGTPDFFENHHAHRELPWDHVPVLLIHGEADFVAPLEQSKMMLKLLKQQGVNATLKTYPGAGHAFNYGIMGRQPQSVDFYKTVRQFMEEHVVNYQIEECAA